MSPPTAAPAGGDGGPPVGRLADVPSGAPARVATPLPGDARLARLSLNQRTTARWSLREAVDGAVAAGLPAIGPWREQLAEAGLDDAVRWIADSGLRVSTLCRGGFFTAGDPAARRRAHETNLRAIDEAAALRAACLVLVPGGLPPGDRDLAAARHRAGEAVADLVPHAHAAGVRLGIEALHPVLAADRGVVSTLAQALAMAAPFPAADVGVVVDTFHLWWEPGVLDLLPTVGDRIAAYQISDWITPLPADPLLGRGMVGDGHVDFAAFTRAVAAAGYPGDVEVEIFHRDVWAAPGSDVVATMARRYVELVEPYLAALADPTAVAGHHGDHVGADPGHTPGVAQAAPGPAAPAD
ncbi:MAG: sugar phosphate isomerase/epimerase family protein [Actinomycetales bacterium]